VTPLYPQKLALTSPTGGGRSVGIVRSRTKATDSSLVLVASCWSKFTITLITYYKLKLSNFYTLYSEGRGYETLSAQVTN